MQETRFDLIVIGAGPGGYVGAIRAAQLGLKTAIIEAKDLGGICLNWGCIPTKAMIGGAELAQKIQHASIFGFEIDNVQFDIKKLVQHSRTVSKQLVAGIGHLLQKNNITLFKGTAKLIAKEKLEVMDDKEQIQILSAPHIIVATGAKATTLPQLPIDGQYIWSYKEALIPEHLPESLLVVGSGAIGSEFASLYHDLGSQVTLIDIAPQIMPTEDHEVAAYVQKQFEQKGITILTQSAIQKTSIIDGKVQCEIQTPQGIQTILANHVLSAIGVTPNSKGLGLEELGVEFDKKFIKTDQWCKTNVVGIYAIGDVAGGPCLAHKASYEAILCVEKIAGVHGVYPLDRTRIPGCIFTNPQVASIGLTQQQATEKGYPVRIGNFPFQANGKALAMNDPVGFVKTIIHQDTGEILGVHMVGHDVTELIQGFSIAKTLEATDESLAEVIFPHPTLSETMHEAILSAMQRAIHI
ncbi:Dihydrolipoamide dehydrogenase (E3) component of pyruvate/2-oxoglutarate dehydrogenase complex or glutathione oxidoreductase (Lpd) (PDB:6QKG) [Commensalibacter communis]|uniref:dihydrolipoyl dehydrogenase n=1 Tax=Commensalibacter communis TaxID=2972786 RepID=UPI0022FF7D20|nr:dihydrolipoyl dehydrogenase [Commensalibacter communis]CAI3937413.1 Dihydrolipoamide dehydrogenase (E3) component of pyruvate/2-oxoglutarate dehydrogenase complex or glutathione oxidoreductase (Lpd) (PDB:6QKG) [Commensalibacter communis]